MENNKDTKFCPKCGSSSKRSTKFCFKCGYKFSTASLASKSEVESQNEKLTNNLAKQDVASESQSRSTGIQTANSEEDTNSEASRENESENESTETNQKSHAVRNIVIAIFIIFFIVRGVHKANIPKGLDTTSEVLTYVGKSKEACDDITGTTALSQVGAYFTNDGGRDKVAEVRSTPAIFVMKNKDSGNFVFKYGDRYIYLIRVIARHQDDGHDQYINVAVGVNKKDGKYYVKELNNKYDDSNAVETDGYTSDNFEQNFSTDKP